jgi:hypothetical protein
VGAAAKTLIFFPATKIGEMDGMDSRPVRSGRTSTKQEKSMHQAKHHNPGARTRPKRPVARAQHIHSPPLLATTWKPDGPTVRFHELLKVVRVGRSTAYSIFKNDPTFPKGTPLFDSPRSPRIWWYDQVIAWLRDREAKANTNTNTNTNTNEEHEHV